MHFNAGRIFGALLSRQMMRDSQFLRRERRPYVIYYVHHATQVPIPVTLSQFYSGFSGFEVLFVLLSAISLFSREISIEIFLKFICPSINYAPTRWVLKLTCSHRNDFWCKEKKCFLDLVTIFFELFSYYKKFFLTAKKKILFKKKKFLRCKKKMLCNWIKGKKWHQKS